MSHAPQFAHWTTTNKGGITKSQVPDRFRTYTEQEFSRAYPAGSPQAELVERIIQSDPILRIPIERAIDTAARGRYRFLTGTAGFVGFLRGVWCELHTEIIGWDPREGRR